jgi:hypothetical protein
MTTVPFGMNHSMVGRVGGAIKRRKSPIRHTADGEAE